MCCDTVAKSGPLLDAQPDIMMAKIGNANMRQRIAPPNNPTYQLNNQKRGQFAISNRISSPFTPVPLGREKGSAGLLFLGEAAKLSLDST